MAKNGTGALYLADLGYPMLPQNATEQEKFDELQDYLFRLTEALRWTLEHLDETNFNANFSFGFEGELYEMLPVKFSVSTYRTRDYEVVFLLPVQDGDLDGTPTLAAFDYDVFAHKPVSSIAAAGTGDYDGNIGDTLAMTGVTVTKGGT